MSLAWPDSRLERQARLEQAILVLVGLWLALVIVDKAKDVLNGCAIAAGALALVRLTLASGPESGWRGAWRLAALLGAFVGAELLSMALAAPLPDRGDLQFRKVHVTGALIALAVGLGLSNRADVKRLFVLLLALAGAWNVFTAASLLWSAPFLDGRLAGFRSAHTVLASELLIVSALFLGAGPIATTKKTIVLLLAGTFLSVALLAMTQTRAALLALAFVTIPAVILLFKRWGSWRRRALALGLWCLLIAPGLGLAWWSLAPSARRDSANVRNRLTAYRIALQVGAREPWHRVLIGNGPAKNVFIAAAAHYRTASPFLDGDALDHAHNTPLQTFLESGVLSLALLAAIWGTALWISLRAWRSAPPGEEWLAGAVAAALLSVAVLGQMNHVLKHVPEALIWLVVGFAFALRPRAEASGVSPGPGAGDVPRRRVAS